MPLPFIIGSIAAVTGIAGVASGIHGGIKMKEANDTMKAAKKKAKKAVVLLKERNNEAMKLMDSIGKQELEILSSFDYFSDIIEKIQRRPDFKTYKREGINLPEYETEELRKVSTGAGVLLGGIGGAAAGTAGGFAAAGATTSAVMALGTASTGTAISSLTGVAATNATLAALGGGSIAVGGGGIALGTTVLGCATLGAGLLVGGIIFNVTGSKLSDKADEAYKQAKRIKKEVNKIVSYYDELCSIAKDFKTALSEVESQYRKKLTTLDHIVNFSEKVDWSQYTDKEKQVIENTILLVGLLYKMCKTSLVLKDANGDGLNVVNQTEVVAVVNDANKVLDDIIIETASMNATSVSK